MKLITKEQRSKGEREYHKLQSYCVGFGYYGPFVYVPVSLRLPCVLLRVASAILINRSDN